MPQLGEEEGAELLAPLRVLASGNVHHLPPAGRGGERGRGRGGAKPGGTFVPLVAGVNAV